MPLSIQAPLPDFDRTEVWFNGPVNRESLRGKPVLVHFWAVSCKLCKEGLHLLEFLRDTRGAEIGLELVGIHTPRIPSDTDLERIAATISEFGLTHPVLADSDRSVANAFRNEFVPSYYLFDENHRLYHYHAGEHALRWVERRLAALAARAGSHPENGGATDRSRY